MRLTCPNCGAQYEVPDQVIPTEGRDVQCSNCGHTWFFAHPDFSEAASSPDNVSEADALRNAIREISEPSQPGPTLRPEPTPDRHQDTTATRAPRRNLDPEVADILREEAQHEAELRAAEAQNALEIQPDLGLDTIGDDAERRAEQARQRMARMRGEPIDTPSAPINEPDRDPKPVSRKEMLPDIEEISSSLRQTGQAGDRTVVAGLNHSRRNAGGFKRGFAVAIIIVVLLGIVYSGAPLIAQTVPQADPILSAFVALVDEGRLWLHQMTRDL